MDGGKQPIRDGDWVVLRAMALTATMLSTVLEDQVATPEPSPLLVARALGVEDVEPVDHPVLEGLEGGTVGDGERVEGRDRNVGPAVGCEDARSSSSWRRRSSRTRGSSEAGSFRAL